MRRNFLGVNFSDELHELALIFSSFRDNSRNSLQIFVRSKSHFLWSSMILLLLWGGQTAVSAHGGGEIKIGRAPIGDYKITVWLNPPQPQAGQTVHVTVGVLGQHDEAVLDAAVTVQAIDADGRIVIDAAATTEQSVNKLFYETDFVLETAVSHQIITTLHKDDAVGSAEFSIEIAEAKPRLNYLWIGLAALLFILLIGLWRSSRAEER